MSRRTAFYLIAFALFACVVSSVDILSESDDDMMSQAEINRIHQEQRTWEAAIPEDFQNTTFGELRKKLSRNPPAELKGRVRPDPKWKTRPSYSTLPQFKDVSSKPQQLQLPSTHVPNGLNASVQSETKDNAVHAGPLLLSKPSKTDSASLGNQILWFHVPHNISSIVHQTKVAAMVATQATLGNSWFPMAHLLNHATLTQLTRSRAQLNAPTEPHSTIPEQPPL